MAIAHIYHPHPLKSSGSQVSSSYIFQSPTMIDAPWSPRVQHQLIEQSRSHDVRGFYPQIAELSSFGSVIPDDEVPRGDSRCAGTYGSQCRWRSQCKESRESNLMLMARSCSKGEFSSITRRLIKARPGAEEPSANTSDASSVMVPESEEAELSTSLVAISSEEPDVDYQELS
jgi:hypothetical protein